ncbi:hypothetical protein SCR00_04520 [Legionella pneumophila serogroup 1]
MTFTCDELKGLEHPYEVLGNGDALAENREELNKLSNDEKLVLASRLVLECPVKQQECHKMIAIPFIPFYSRLIR